GRRNFVKCVLVGLGEQIEEGPMEELDDLDTGTSVDVWDHKIARDMRALTDVFAELADENVIVAPTAKVLTPGGQLIKKFITGLPAKVEFRLPPEATGFVLEMPGRRIEQPLAGR